MMMRIVMVMEMGKRGAGKVMSVLCNTPRVVKIDSRFASLSRICKDAY